MKARRGFTLVLLFPSALLADDVQFFETKVRPLFAWQCYSCHSSKSKIAQGGLRLDSRQGAMQGGHLGPAVVPGNPDDSRLIRAVRHQVEPNMPPWGKLKPDQIEALEEWVRRGAPWPTEAAPERAATEPDSRAQAKKHWAWQPIQSRQPPDVKNSTWPFEAIDRFLLHKLEDTLVVWGGEFGRTPFDQDLSLGSAPEEDRGREHNPHGFTMWLAGAASNQALSTVRRMTSLTAQWTGRYISTICMRRS
jgi:hypothetical protein